MHDTKRSDQERAAYRAELLAPLLALHPKTAKPTHGCCAPPKLCGGHPPECRSSEHQIGSGVRWPCPTLRVVGITSDADAVKIRALLDGGAR